VCGFLAVIGGANAPTVGEAVALLRHRGPDDHRVWEGDIAGQQAALGFQRLAIIDVAQGAQPMATSDGDLVIVFNGAIYNHRELRRQLERDGVEFRTDHSDTEVLLMAYRRWGLAIFDHLNGMYAFVLLDRARGKVLLGRDRFGKKPLFYRVDGEGLTVASELRAAVAFSSSPRKIDRAALIRYFSFGYIPSPATLFEGVAKLPAGHFAEYDVASRRISVEPHWRYRIEPSDPPPGNLDDWGQQLLQALTAAVECRLDSDRPVGFFLSGGIDSTAVVAIARRLSAESDIRTFNIAFSEPSYDESGPAAMVADVFGTTHMSRTLDMSKGMTTASELLCRLDEPIYDSSIVPTYLLSLLAKEQVAVALSGDGSDELFAGYDTFLALGSAWAYSRFVPNAVGALARKAVALMPISDRRMSFEFRLRMAMRGASRPEALWHPSWLAPVDPEALGALFETECAAETVYADVADLWNRCANRNLVDRALEYFVHYYLAGDILTKTDRASMTASLEVRSPFLDRRVADFALALPSWAKYGLGRRKRVLRNAIASMVPRSILGRRKQGFNVPLRSWLRTAPPPDPVLAKRLGLNAIWLEKCWNDNRIGAADWRGLLWSWFALERCLEGYTRAGLSFSA